VRIQRLLANACFQVLKSAPEEEKICLKKKSHKVLFYVKNKKTGNVFFSSKYCCIFSIWWNKTRQICYSPPLQETPPIRSVGCWRPAVWSSTPSAIAAAPAPTEVHVPANVFGF
jgi:hypothetical protein